MGDTRKGSGNECVRYCSKAIFSKDIIITAKPHAPQTLHTRHLAITINNMYPQRGYQSVKERCL